MVSFRDYLVEQENENFLQELQQEILNSLDFNFINEKSGWIGASKKFIDNFWGKMLASMAKVWGTEVVDKLKDEVKAWAKEDKIKPKYFKELKNRAIKAIQSCKSSIEKNQAKFRKNESFDENIDITLNDLKEFFKYTNNNSGLLLIEKAEKEDINKSKDSNKKSFGQKAFSIFLRVLSFVVISFVAIIFVKGVIAICLAYTATSAVTAAAGLTTSAIFMIIRQKIDSCIKEKI